MRMALPAGEMCAVSSERREACILRTGHEGRHSWARCTAQRGWLAADSLTVHANVQCELRAGHDGEHRGEIGWPS